MHLKVFYVFSKIFNSDLKQNKVFKNLILVFLKLKFFRKTNSDVNFYHPH